MGKLVYARAINNVAPNAIVTINTGTEDPDFLIAGAAPAPIADLNPAKKKAFTGVTGSLVYDFTVAQLLNGVAIIHHNLTAGLLDVSIQGNATDSWGSPTLDVDFVIPAVDADGFRINPWLDLSGEGSKTFRFWRIVVATANGANVAYGQILLLDALFKPIHNVKTNADEDEDHPIIEHRTDFGVSAVFDYGIRSRQLSGTILTTTAEADIWRETQRQARGRARAFFFARDRDVNDAMFVRFTRTKYGRKLRSHEIHVLPFSVQEVSRGLPL